MNPHEFKFNIEPVREEPAWIAYAIGGVMGFIVAAMIASAL